ncbi:MAG: hypothetical protein ACOCQ3_00280 [Natronomonas sp.]
MLAEVDHLEDLSVGNGRYVLELITQIKTYLLLDGPLEISVNPLETRIELEETKPVVIGAVSWHDRPATTVTSTSSPVDMMAAISTFGSALKTTSPERSFPSNRGHPPAILLGESLDIPSIVESPNTGIKIEIPPTYDAVFAVSPLAYYLAAEVVPGSTPKLVTSTGFEYRLDSADNIEKGVEQVLKQVFLSDCITRTEGVYEIEMRERNILEPHLNFNFAALYDRPLAEQVETYLSVPYAVVADSIPEWRLTVHVQPDADTVEQIPYVVDDLAIVRSTTGVDGTETVGPEPVDSFSRNGLLTRSSADTEMTASRSYVELRSDSSLEQAWIGGSIPIGASKLTMEAFKNRLDREANTGDISITVVLNDPRMDEESELVDEIYGDRDDLPFDVQIYDDLHCDELRETLRADSSFFHYIGHIEHDGFQCSDGTFDASTLESTGVDSFLLNACNSYEQGIRLIEAGAVGGIVTLSEIINTGAIQIGETIARLLNSGYPLRAALSIAREESLIGGQYIVVGDGGMTVTQAPSRTPNLLDISVEPDVYNVDIYTYATDGAGLGSVYKPHIAGNDEYYLSSGKIGEFHVSKEELSAFLELENVPVRNDGDLHWSKFLDLDNIV